MSWGVKLPPVCKALLGVSLRGSGVGVWILRVVIHCLPIIHFQNAELLMEEIRQSPVDMVNIPLFTRLYTYQLVRDFFHQQYCCSTNMAIMHSRELTYTKPDHLQKYLW